jgi:hypothetical protein
MVFQGFLLFGLAAILLVIAFFAMRSRRERYEEAAPEEDRLSDEEFRRIEFGDED